MRKSSGLADSNRKRFAKPKGGDKRFKQDFEHGDFMRSILADLILVINTMGSISFARALPFCMSVNSHSMVSVKIVSAGKEKIGFYLFFSIFFGKSIINLAFCCVCT